MTVNPVDAILQTLVSETSAITALVISRQGICIGQAGASATLNSTALAALVAGMFSATKEVANIVGENQFSMLLQQGEKRNIHISLIGEKSMLVVVFEDHSRIGKVRYAVRSCSDKLFMALKASEPTADQFEDLSVSDFKEYALNLIDRIFVVGDEPVAPH